MAGKYHVWINKSSYGYDRVVLTQSANPAVGDPVDVSGYSETLGDETAYYSFENWNNYTIQEVKNENKLDYGYKPFVTVVVNAYENSISGVYGPGVVPKKYVWANGTLSDYYVSKHFWPDGVRFKVIFTSDTYDPALEGPYVTDSNYNGTGSIPWSYNPNTDTVSVSNTPNNAYDLYCASAGSWSSYSAALVDYCYFRIGYTGPQ